MKENLKQIFNMWCLCKLLWRNVCEKMNDWCLQKRNEQLIFAEKKNVITLKVMFVFEVKNIKKESIVTVCEIKIWSWKNITYLYYNQ